MISYIERIDTNNCSKGRKTISSEVYGDTDDEETLKARLMNRYKVVHGERPQWKLTSVKLNKVI